MPAGTYTNLALAEQLLAALDAIFGMHLGFRPVHAKGLMGSGTFTPAPEAVKLTRAPHANKPSTPVTVRYSDSTGVPTIPDNDPQRSGPRGFAVRFHLGDHAHTDIVAHSTNGFPVRTGEEFLEFLRAAAASGAGKPEALGAFLAAHPGAKRFVEAAKPIPTSFAREAFFAVTAFRFTNSAGVSRHGRFRIRPEAGTEHLTDEEAARKPANFLFDEIGPRLAQAPIRLGIFVQMAEPGDDVANASVTWPDNRVEIPFGTLTLTARVDDQEPERRGIIFDPVPRVDGIDSSGDPLTEVRSDIYLLSGRRRRAASDSTAEREFVITRVLDVPRALVFDAWTDPRHMARWWGPHVITIPVCEMDVRPGGAWRIVMRGPDGVEYRVKGVFVEVENPHHLVMTMDCSEHPEAWHDQIFPDRKKGERNPAGEMLMTVNFQERAGRTALTVRVRFDSAAIRDAMVKAGMNEGWSQTLERLAGLLAKTPSL
jgi:catalase